MPNGHAVGPARAGPCRLDTPREETAVNSGRPRLVQGDRDLLLQQVATHAADHGITEITPEVLQAVESRIVAVA